MAGERSFTPAEIRSFVGAQLWIADEHEKAGLGTPEFWDGWKKAIWLVHGYIVGDIDESGIPVPGEITRKAKECLSSPPALPAGEGAGPA